MTSLPAFHAANRKNIPLYLMSVKVCVAANKRISRTPLPRLSESAARRLHRNPGCRVRLPLELGARHLDFLDGGHARLELRKLPRRMLAQQRSVWIGMEDLIPGGTPAPTPK